MGTGGTRTPAGGAMRGGAASAVIFMAPAALLGVVGRLVGIAVARPCGPELEHEDPVELPMPGPALGSVGTLSRACCSGGAMLPGAEGVSFPSSLSPNMGL